MAYIVQRSNEFQTGQHAGDTIETASIDLRIEMAADKDRRQAVIAAGPAPEDRTHPVDLDGQSGRLAPFDKLVSHLAVTVRQRQTGKPALAALPISAER